MGAPKYKLAKLHGRIIEQYGSVAAFAKAIGKSPATMSAKLNLERQWTWSEVGQTCRLLNIPIAKASAYIFFE